MTLRPRHPALACAFLFVLVVSAGCLGLGAQSDLPDRATVTDSLQSIETVEATVTVEQSTPNETTTRTIDLLRQTKTGKLRETIYRSSPDVTIEMVSNGTTTWMYNRSSETVQRFRMEGVQTRWNRSVESIGSLFARLNRGASDDVSISPLPVVPGGGSSGGMASFPAMGNVSVTYAGTTLIGGRNAHEVALTPTTNASVISNATIWFDAERYFPIKARYEMAVGGSPRTVTLTYRNLTYNAEVPDGTFTFDPPPDADVSDSTSSLAIHQSRAALENATDQSVPDPDVPDGYAFAQASTVEDGNLSGMALQYSNGAETIVVSKESGGTPAEDFDRGESVDVAGQRGYYRTSDGAHVIAWRCDGTRYWISAALPKSDLQEIAESMACE